LSYYFECDATYWLPLTLGLGVVGGFGKRPPGTEADALLMYKIRTNVHRCLSCPNKSCHVVEDEDNKVMPQ